MTCRMRYAPMALLSLAMAPIGARVQAQDPKPRAAEFTGDLGLVNAAGNSNVTSINLGDKLVLRSGDSRHVFTQVFGLVYGRSEGETIANNWRGSGRYELGLSKRVSLYGLVAAERNRFAGILRRFEEGPGLIVTLVSTARNMLSVEVGASMVQQRSTDGVDDSFASGRSALLFQHQFSEKAKFGQALEFLPNLEQLDDYRINSESSLVAPISSSIAIKVAYVIRFDNTPLVTATQTFKKTDRLLTSGIQITL